MPSDLQEENARLRPPLRQVMVEEALEKILSDDSFRTSRQSEKLLRYLVTHSLDGQEELLREKQVGVGVFGREFGYDTTADPIVRVRANEIRKRLARYYEESGKGQPVRLEMPPGSYRVNFQFTEAEPAVAMEPPPIDNEPTPVANSRRQFLGVGGVALASVCGWQIWQRVAIGPLEQFWEPAIRAGGPVILCSGHPVVYRFSKDFMQRNGTPTFDYLTYQTAPFEVPKEKALRGDDIVPIRDQYIGIGSAFAAAKVSSLMAKRGKEVELRFGNDISFTDLKRSTAVLIGAFSNRWTLELSKTGRFEFVTANGFPGLRDRQSSKTWFAKNLHEDGSTDDDYVLVKRLIHSETGQFVVTLGGLTQYGSQAAADLVTLAGPMKNTAAGLPADWHKRNMELLFHVPVIRGSPGTPKLLEHYLW